MLYYSVGKKKRGGIALVADPYALPPLAVLAFGGNLDVDSSVACPHLLPPRKRTAEEEPTANPQPEKSDED